MLGDGFNFFSVYGSADHILGIKKNSHATIYFKTNIMFKKQNVQKNLMAEQRSIWDTENILTMLGNAFHNSVVLQYYADNSLFSDCLYKIQMISLLQN